ncbi:MAG: hypothetical protein F6K11_08330 [Leptolyngbya sp. SIO3F4]|nr:hypothetical protein [Leptolyngbya sp. SIO3F4]
MSHGFYAAGKEPTSQQTIKWLSFLAKRLKADSQSEFLIENLHPGWLKTSNQKRLYRIMLGLVFGLTIGLITGFWWEAYRGLVAYASEGLMLSLASGLFFGVITSIIYGTLWAVWGGLGVGLSNRSVKLFFYLPTIGAFLGGISEYFIAEGSFSEGVVVGAVLGLIFSVFFILNSRKNIRFLETLSWSIDKAKSGALYGFALGCLFVMLASFSEGLELQFRVPLTFALIGLFIGAPIGGTLINVNVQAIISRSLSKVSKGAIRGCFIGLGITCLLNILMFILAFLGPESFKEFLPSENAILILYLITWAVLYEFIGGVIGSVFGGIGAVLFCSLTEMLQTVRTSWKTPDKQKWSWKGFRKGSFFGLLLGAFIGMLFIGKILGDTLLLRIVALLGYIISFGMIGTLIGFIVGGFRGPEIEVRKHPNQGIWKSVTNSITISLIAGLMVFLVLLAFAWPNGVWLQGVNYGLIFGPLVGIICGTALGGTCFSHVAIRIALYKSGLAPWNYRRFLSYASERMLMRQIGGRYQFIHGIVQEHFINC